MAGLPASRSMQFFAAAKDIWNIIFAQALLIHHKIQLLSGCLDQRHDHIAQEQRMTAANVIHFSIHTTQQYVPVGANGISNVKEIASGR
jgi:hypothetical protein